MSFVDSLVGKLYQRHQFQMKDDPLHQKIEIKARQAKVAAIALAIFAAIALLLGAPLISVALFTGSALLYVVANDTAKIVQAARVHLIPHDPEIKAKFTREAFSKEVLYETFLLKHV